MPGSNRAEIMASELFRFSTSASPQQVWEALTRPELTERYRHGLRLQGTWRPGSVLVVRGPGSASLHGEVLAAEPAARLSYALSSGDGQPWTYLTWEIRGAGTGAVVRLSVDEPDGTFPAIDEEEDAWLNVTARLEQLLREGAAKVSVAQTGDSPPVRSGDRDRLTNFGEQRAID